ncbi:MAG: ASKHA domain-containing protein [Alphaproteobacteria bacterium]|nr:ASKHA domain-containing protein [Alphaproteobacteria bacterium]
MSEPSADLKSPEEALVVFLPSGRRGHFAHGTSLLQAARSLGVDIDSVCGGRGLCGRCQISVSSGAFAKFNIVSEEAHLSTAGELEARYGARRGLSQGRRLSCAANILGDAVIDVPAESQLHKQIVRKRAEVRAVEIDPVLRLHYVEIERPSLEDQTSDLVRLEEALAAQWELTGLTIDLAVLQRLSPALREGEWALTVAVRDGREVVAVWPGFRERAYGLAIDVGTTTIAAHLSDLATGEVIAASGVMNPQIRFGEDVMSRLSYLQLNPDDADKPTAVVREAIDNLAAETALAGAVAPEDILELTIVGNPVMHHCLLGLNALQLGAAPFPLVTENAFACKARELDLNLHAEARVYVLPCIAGHVGADTAGVVLSEAPHEADEITLLVDVGTNAEIVLGNKERLLACSSPTGPAFEGAQISAGQRAALGAVERVRIEPKTLTPRIKVIGSDKWSDEAGFEDEIAEFGVTGICGSGIIEAVAEMYLAGIVTPSGLIDGKVSESSPHVVADGRTFAYRLRQGQPELLVTQTDIRAIQLAKAALYAGARLLMDRLGVEMPDRIVLAGAFGSYIDPSHAMAIGLIPDCPLDRVSSAGNAAGTGARIALLNRASRAEIEAVVRRIEKIETAAEPLFQDYFVAAMAIPHQHHEFPNADRQRGPTAPDAAVAAEATPRRRGRRRA